MKVVDVMGGGRSRKTWGEFWVRTCTCLVWNSEQRCVDGLNVGQTSNPSLAIMPMIVLLRIDCRFSPHSFRPCRGLWRVKQEYCQRSVTDTMLKRSITENYYLQWYVFWNVSKTLLSHQKHLLNIFEASKTFAEYLWGVENILSRQHYMVQIINKLRIYLRFRYHEFLLGYYFINKIKDQYLCLCSFTQLEDTIELIRLIVSTGVQAVTIHGRTKDERPTHPNHNDVISAIVDEVNIPVIAKLVDKYMYSYTHEKNLNTLATFKCNFLANFNC